MKWNIVHVAFFIIKYNLSLYIFDPTIIDVRHMLLQCLDFDTTPTWSITHESWSPSVFPLEKCNAAGISFYVDSKAFDQLSSLLFLNGLVLKHGCTNQAKMKRVIKTWNYYILWANYQGGKKMWYFLRWKKLLFPLNN